MDEIEYGPQIVHPEIESAVGSRNSLARKGRLEYKESSLLIDEEVDKILNHISSKLPPEVLNKVDVMNGVKEKLHNYYNLSIQNSLKYYLIRRKYIYASLILFHAYEIPIFLRHFIFCSG